MVKHCVGIVTDSVADLPAEVLSAYGIKVLPVYVMMDGKTYRDDGTLDRTWFYAQLEKAGNRPTTASPPPEEFLHVYQELARQGVEEIVALLTASTVSSLYAHAALAAQRFHQVPVHVLDTLQVSTGVGWLVTEMAERLADGWPVAQAIEHVRALREHVRVLGVLKSVDFLHRSGRVGWIKSQIADLLRIRPVIAFERGEASLLRRVRTYGRGIEAVAEQVAQSMPLRKLAILHSGADQTALSRLRASVAQCVGDLWCPVVKVGPIFASHVGPGCLGVALIRDPAGF